MVKSKTKSSLSGRIYDFTRAVIRHRKLLITEKKSTINLMRAQNIIEALTRNLNPKFTDVAAAKFFIRHQAEIKYLIKHDDVNKFNTLNQLLMISNPLSKL